MAGIGIVRGASLGVGYRGDSVVLLTVEMDDPSDIQTVEYLFGAGESFLPPLGSEVVVHTVSDEQKIAVGCDMNVVSVVGLNPGDRRLFAVSDGATAAMIDLLGTGELVLNGGEGFAVSFEKLKAGFDQLVSDFNAHVHAGSGTIPPNPSSVASIDDCKVEQVRI